MENTGVRAPPPPYFEALSYPLTADKDEEETEVKKKPCIQWDRKCSLERPTSPEVPNAESTSLYPISMLSLHFPSSNSECSDNSSETTLKKVPLSSRCTSVPLAKGANVQNSTFRNNRNSCSDINQIQTPKPHENLGVSENSSASSSSELSSESEACQTLRPYSPQPGPSGYNGIRGKARAQTGMAVKFNNREGVYRVVTTSESSDNIYSTNCTTSITDFDEERDNSAADRGTLYCACGILISIITLVLLLVNFA